MSTEGEASLARASEADIMAVSSTSASLSTELAIHPIRSMKDGEPTESDGRWGEAYSEPVNVDDALDEYEG